MLPIRRGRLPTPIAFVCDRELTQSDIIRLLTEERKKTSMPMVQKLTIAHHTAARLVAEGFSDIDVGIQCGRTAVRIRQLRDDPSFMELVAYYLENRTDAELEAGARLRTTLTDIAQLSAVEIRARLEDEAKMKEIPVSELRQLVATGADRTVAPPKTAVSAPTQPASITFNIGGAAGIKLKDAVQVGIKIIDNESQK